MIALTLIPLVTLILLELALRVCGYGYDSHFFRKTNIRGKSVFVENDQFGRRFFPQSLARSPSPTVMSADKSSNAWRIFVLGESAALGDPEPAFGFGRYLETLLRVRHPATRFEVIPVAMTAINSHALLPMARESARHQGDLWVVYMGNNEMMGPFGAGAIFGARAPRLEMIRAGLALKTTRIGQLIDATFQTLSAGGSPRSWQGMKMFAEHQVRLDDPGRQQVYGNFKKNLDDILRAGNEAGVKIVLCTVAGNLKDCAPFASLHSANLNERQQSAWNRLLLEGDRLEHAGAFPEALDNYSQLARMDPGFADLQFRLGRCYLALTNLDQARRCFERARDCDALPFRTDSRLNALIKEAGKEFAGRGVITLDVEESLARAATQQIPGNDLFYEHVHLNFTGNQALARAVAEQVEGLLPSSVAGQDPAGWASNDRCEQRLAVTDWDRHRVFANILQRSAESPFTLQSDHALRIQSLTKIVGEIGARMGARSVPTARELYQRALADAPDDFLLHGNFARLLEETGDLAGAVAEWKRVEELLPYHYGPSFYLGKLYARAGRYPEAEQSLGKTLRIRPTAAEAMDELGQVLTRQKKGAEAVAHFHRALRLQPGSARLYFHLAQALGDQEKREEAVNALRKAVELEPDYWEAHYFLGVELAVRNKIPEAREQFKAVVRLKPDYPLAHLNLGVALAHEGSLDEALAEFQETLRLDPNNKSAQDHLQGIRLLKDREH